MCRKRFSLLLFTLTLFAIHASAQKRVDVLLEPDSSAMLYVYLPNAEKSTGRAVVCYPGGAYVCQSHGA